jgi:DNA (cytosine-5)-methyltransferase 1
MRYATLCSGIETPTVAWKPFGWKAVWHSEIEPFPNALLAHHYPQVPNLGDMTRIHGNETYQTQPVDIICAGTPCQSFSLAGLRGGMADPRGNLTIHLLRILAERRPRWLVWENVPDIMSSWSDAETDSEGRIWQTNDFDTFLAGLRQVGYSVAWRILDAQYFGLAQRRERLFVVGHLGNDWRPPYAVLSDPSSLSGHPPPSRCAGASVAALTANGVGTCGADDNQARAGHIITAPVTSKLAKGIGGPAGDECQNFVVGTLTECMNDKWGSNQWVDQQHYVVQPIADTLTANWHKSGGSCAGTRTGKGMINPVINTQGIRRLTPLECERLQGFPDNYTRIPYRGKPADRCPDSPRYRAIGNAMPVPVMAWIGRKIKQYESLQMS